MTDVMAVGYPTPELRALDTRVHKARIELIERAKASGELRADCTPRRDVALLVLALAGIIQHTGTPPPATSERFLSFALDGFRAEAATPAPTPIPREKLRAAPSTPNQKVAGRFRTSRHRTTQAADQLHVGDGAAHYLRRPTRPLAGWR